MKALTSKMLTNMLTLKNLSTFEDAQGNIEEVQYSSKMLIMESVGAFDEHLRAPRARYSPVTTNFPP
jgi:hypothetical protein